MDDAVVLYGISETHCKTVITEEPVLRSILLLIERKLNYRGIYTAELRHQHGNRFFEELLAKERIHRDLLAGQHINETLLPWLQEE